jgi:hypothetical protein
VTGELEVSPDYVLDEQDSSAQKPDFLMVGLQDQHTGVLLFASTTLSKAGLRRKIVGYLTDPQRPRTRIPVEEATVTAVMRDFTVIHADSYQQALADLMADWARKARMQQRGIEQ